MSVSSHNNNDKIQKGRETEEEQEEAISSRTYKFDNIFQVSKREEKQNKGSLREKSDGKIEIAAAEREKREYKQS